jgi:hypothetical protein
VHSARLVRERRQVSVVDGRGADWIAIGEEAVDVVAQVIYCGSPSAAFLD